MDGTILTGRSQVAAITFDIWETLLFEKDGADSRRTACRCRNIAHTLNNFGIEISVEQVADAMKETDASLLKIWERNKDVTHLDQLHLLIKHALESSTTLTKERINELSSAYISPFYEIPPYLNPNAREVLRSLKYQNKLIGLICNTGHTPGFTIKKFLEREDVAEYFQLMLFSDEVGIRKPDSKIFHLAAQRLYLKPHEIVHVGDNLRTDVWGAKKAGLKAIWLSSEEGHDRGAESDPTSLVSISRDISNLKNEETMPDKTISSISLLEKTIEEIERADYLRWSHGPL